MNMTRFLLRSQLKRSQLKTLTLASFAFFIAVILVLYPEQAVKSSLRGLTIWWDVVFPALLPFFITAEMMMGFGVVHFLGVLLEPLMRPIFRVPGAGAFVMAVGLISGNPMGAKLTARLREQGLVSREEGERLVSFTSTAGPLFLFGAIAVGFFENTWIGIILAIAHYGSAMLVGILMRFYERQAPPSSLSGKKAGFILFRALRAMHRARLKDSRTLGQLIGQSVTSAVQTLLLIGGFIMMFSVLTHLINYVGITRPLENGISYVLDLCSLPRDLATPVLAGLFEITLGSQLASAVGPTAPLIYKLTIVSLVVGWNGLSIHAQVASMISRTDLRYFPYFMAKILHGLLAAVITVLIYPKFAPHLAHAPDSVPVFSHFSTTFASSLWQALKWMSFVALLLWFVYTLLEEWKDGLGKLDGYDKTR
jgi:sporulation integral membrane protein YlbJ